MNSATDRAYLASLNLHSAADQATREAAGLLGAYEKAAALDPVGQATREALGHLGAHGRAAVLDPVGEATREALEHLRAHERAAVLDPIDQATREALGHLGAYKRTAAIDPVGQATREALGDLGVLSSGLSEHLRAAIGPSLAANEVASLKLSEQLKAIREGSGQPAPYDAAEIEVPPLSLPPFVENPAYETNERLAQMTEHISQMRDLAVSTAQMQQTLNDVAKTILTEFSQGAETSNKATKRAMWIAVVSAALSLVAIVVGVWGVLHQDAQTAERELAVEAGRAQLIETQRQNTAALERVSRNLEVTSPPAQPKAPKAATSGPPRTQ